MLLHGHFKGFLGAIFSVALIVVSVISCSRAASLNDFVDTEIIDQSLTRWTLLYSPTKVDAIDRKVVSLVGKYEQFEEVIFNKLLLSDFPSQDDWSLVRKIKRDLPHGVSLMLFDPSGTFRGQWELVSGEEQGVEDFLFLKGMYSFHKGVTSDEELLADNPLDKLTEAKQYFVKLMDRLSSQVCLILDAPHMMCERSVNIIPEFNKAYAEHNPIFILPARFDEDNIRLICENYGIDRSTVVYSSELVKALDELRYFNLNISYCIAVYRIDEALNFEYITTECNLY